MFLKQFYHEGIAHYSYLLIASNQATVIDPAREVDAYLELAAARNVEITQIWETHLHADFISGHLELARKTGATIFAPAKANCLFGHQPLKEGDILELEKLKITVLETPGHTPEHVAFVVADLDRGDVPLCLFSGDTLLVGDVGRPDLFPRQTERLAQELFHSLHDKLLKLPDFCEVYPAHGAGSLCGREISNKPSSTIGYERLLNPALKITDETEFVRFVTTDMPPIPDYFTRCSALNGQGPALLEKLPEIRPLSVTEFAAKTRIDGCPAIDTRHHRKYAHEHIPGSLNFSFDLNFPLFAGWLLPPEDEIVLITDSAEDVASAVRFLHQVGIDHIAGWLDGGVRAWKIASLPTASFSVFGEEEFLNRLQNPSEMQLVDVRQVMERAGTDIPEAINIPVPELRQRSAELPENKQLILICQGGARGSLAAGLLWQNGFRNLVNVAGGFDDIRHLFGY